MDMIQTIQYYDMLLLDFIHNNLRSSVLDKIMPYITVLGNDGIIWIALALIFLCFKSRRVDGIGIVIALVLSLLVVNLGLKPLVARIRPYDINTAVKLLVSRPTDFSFPSGHTSASFAAASAIFIRNRRFGIPALILASLIAFSRLYLYLHFPTDILASVALGLIFGAAACRSIKIYANKNSRPV